MMTSHMRPHEMHQGHDLDLNVQKINYNNETFEAYYMGWDSRARGRLNLPPYQSGSRKHSLYLNGYIDRISYEKKKEEATGA